MWGSQSYYICLIIVKSYDCDMAKLCETMNDDVSSIREYIDQMLQKLTRSAYNVIGHTKDYLGIADWFGM